MKFRFVLGIAILASITQLGLAADRRIKDITDTATSAAADDYLIIDGTTNGTRNILTTKLPVSEAQQTALDGKAGLTGTSAFLSGAAVTFNAGSSATFNGTLGGTPTGGTLDLSLVTVSLGSVTVGTLNVTAFGTGTLLGANGGTGVANTGKTITLGGNLTTSGAHATTFTTTGTTTVTLPTTGTLATTAQITGTNSGTNTGDQNIFAGVAVSGETTVTAASPTGNITFVEGSGMTITTDNTAKTVTFAASGSGIAAGMGLFWQTADLGSLSSDYFAAGLYGTGTGGTVGDWTLITKSLGTLATPTVSPAAGEIADGSTITFSSTDSGVTFRHTTSGTDPTYTTGTTGATTTLSGATTYEYISTKPGYPPSAVQSVTYTVPAVGYTYYSTAFDGTNDYLVRAEPTGAVDGQKGILSVWIKMDPSSSDTTAYRVIGSASDRIFIYRDTSGRFVITLAKTGGLAVVSMRTGTNSVTNSSGWHHVLAAWDAATSGAYKIYLDGVDATSVQTFSVGDTIDYATTGTWSIGATTSGTVKFYGLMSELYFNTAEYLDLSVSGNRDKFSAAGAPISLGSDGSTPTGTAPIIYMKTVVPDWETNSGTGGNFTETGTLVDGGSDKP